MPEPAEPGGPITEAPVESPTGVVVRVKMPHDLSLEAPALAITVAERAPGGYHACAGARADPIEASNPGA